MPGGELLEGAPGRGDADRSEALAEPGLEPGQVGVAAGEQPVVDEQQPDVLSRGAGRRGVEAVIVERDASLAECPEQLPDPGIAFPDGYRPLTVDERRPRIVK